MRINPKPGPLTVSAMPPRLGNRNAMGSEIDCGVPSLTLFCRRGADETRSGRDMKVEKQGIKSSSPSRRLPSGLAYATQVQTSIPFDGRNAHCMICHARPLHLDFCFPFLPNRGLPLIARACLRANVRPGKQLANQSQVIPSATSSHRSPS
jgi:hypothetical protein